MNESKLTYLFQAYFNKTASLDERDELMELLSQAENDALVKLLLTKAWEEFRSQNPPFNESRGEEMLTHIFHKGSISQQAPVIHTHTHPFFTRFRFWAAASIVLFAITGTYFALQPKQTGTSISHSKITPSKDNKPIVPGVNKAVLTLADGSHLLLDSSGLGTLAKQGDAKVVKLNTATLTYHPDEENSHEIVYNTLSTPSGGQYQLILPDGTKAWLNSSSSIHYPTIFKGKERNVSITGEVYFEVAKNAAMPFKISVKDMEVQVLGTHFNIMAYTDENSINTTLVEGSIKVSKGSVNRTLLPGQESRISTAGEIKVVEANIEEVVAWKNGWFQFDGQDIQKIMRQISRWYDVEIVYRGAISTSHFSGIVSRENDILKVLKIMKDGGVHFKIEGRRVFVLP